MVKGYEISLSYLIYLIYLFWSQDIADFLYELKSFTKLK